MDRAKNLPLRNYSIRELLDRLVQIYRQNFSTFIGLVIVIQVPLTLLTYWFDQHMQTSSATVNSLLIRLNDPSSFPAALRQLLGLLIIPYFAVNLVNIFTQFILIYCPLVYLTSESLLGHRATLREAISAVSWRLSTLVGGLLVYLLTLAAFLIVQIPILWACGLGIGVTVYLGTAVGTFLAPVLVLERIGILDGLSRSWLLGKSRIWPILGLTLGVLFLSFLPGLIISFIVGMILDIISSTGIIMLPYPAVLTGNITGLILGIMVSPVLPIGYTLLYYNARIRLERLDLALYTARQANPNATPADIAAPLPGKLMTRDDLMNLGIVTMATFILLLLFAALLYALIGSSAVPPGSF